MTVPIHIGSTKQLFLDDHVVDILDSVTRQFRRPVRISICPASYAANSRQPACTGS